MLSDQEIVLKCKKGSPDAQRMLYARYAPVMKLICMRYIKDKAEVKDVLQDSFVKVFRSIKDFKEEGVLEGWIRRIVVNTSLDHLRKQKAIQSFTVNIEEEPLLVDDSDDSDDDSLVCQIMAIGFSKELLLRLLHNLPTKYAAVFNMFYIDEMPHREIADLLQMTENLSRKYAFRAKVLVKNQLIDYLQENLRLNAGIR